MPTEKYRVHDGGWLGNQQAGGIATCLHFCEVLTMLNYMVNSLKSAMDTGIGFEFRFHTMSQTEQNAIIACCEFLAYTGLILWFVRENEELQFLNVIPQPKF